MMKLTSETGPVGKAKSGLLWGFGFRLFHNVLQFALTLVLARLLSPEDYGTFAVVAGIIGFLNAVNFDSFLSHVLQIRDDKEVAWQDHFTAAVAIQSVIFVITNVLALLLRLFPSHAQIAGYIHFLSPIILLSSVGGYRYRMLERMLDWQRYRLLQSIGLALALVSVLALALCGAGVYALLIGPNLKYLPPMLDLLWVQRWRPTWEFSWPRYRPAFLFGLNRVSSEFVNKGRAMLEANWLVILIGLQTLGYLNRAVGLTQLITAQFTSLIAQSLYPVLTRIEPGTARFRQATGLVARGIAWVLVPAACLLGLLATPAIRTLFGEKWLPSAGYLPLTLVLGCLTAFGQTGSVFLLASCRQRQCLYYDLLRLAGTALALALWGLHPRLEFYLLSLAAVEALSLALIFTWLRSASALSLSGMMAAIAPPVMASAVSYAAVTLLPTHTPESGLFSPNCVMTVALFGGTYILCLRTLCPLAMQELVRVLPLGPQLSRLLLFRARVAA